MDFLKRVNIELTKAEYKTASMRMEGKHGYELLATGYGDGARIYLVKDKVAQYMYSGVYNQARKHPNSNPLKTRLEETFKLEYWLNPENRRYASALGGNNSGNMVVQTWSPMLRDINAFIFWLNGMNGRPMTPENTQTVTLGDEHMVVGPNLTMNGFMLQKVTLSYHHLGFLRTTVPNVEDISIPFGDMLAGKQLPNVINSHLAQCNRVPYARTPEETAAYSYIERQFYFKDELGRTFSTTQTLGHDYDITAVDIHTDDKVLFMSMGLQY